MYSRIVVGTDGTDRSLIAVDHAAQLAAVCSAELHVVAAASPPNRQRRSSAIGETIVELSDASARTAARIGRDASRRHGVRVVEHPRVGDPVAVLIAVAERVGADLIVVGSPRAAGQARRLTGSVPGRLAHHWKRPLLVVHTG
jgi:nucleotide-binding universal stress UspA family protein